MAVRTLETRTDAKRGVVRSSVPRRTSSLAVIPFANAVVVVAAATYLICGLVALASVDALIGFFQPWFHGVSLQLLRPADSGFRLDIFAVGLITFSASVWVATAAVARLYNFWARR